ncbi:Putative nudix hydrolase 6 [Caenorhabditis elegans]|uniref:Putative nudix hydrolase 6 n=1 Tax=Caenorhabditis elegans TaxID=6239 RepID=NDX6_CAEEL|nr:Putative nudix hydrolase 6 [Caenorhabditis elegans]Q09297.2 RecName: Full=Putative nudix hydrolase 6 [Caenorhabditis elegans]CCD68736.1 Putative nudix hydrolase 6 [Caenorhabditis elegans]|eukprot:NP_495015.1 Putative nudix hydrolase 6 [Caenorhabditis elegans]
MSFVHQKCRNIDTVYLGSNIHRLNVPDNLVKWSQEWSGYNPPAHTDPKVDGAVWADPEIDEKTFQPSWNAIDGKINRVSYVCQYSFDPVTLRPLNPIGRTGLSGRGLLGRWGPNHAADPIVSRTNDNGDLEFVAVQRHDNGEWAIPGGMVDAGEHVSQTLRREFAEEAMHGIVDSENLDELWNNGKELYRGYVDDPRNTDNAWMETVVFNFHDSKGLLKNVALQAGDDAKALRWIAVNSNEPLYASHSHFIDLLKESHSH